MPIFSINEPAKGAKQAKTTNIKPIAFATLEICQPNSSVIGNMIICGTLETDDAAMVMINVITAIIQP